MVTEDDIYCTIGELAAGKDFPLSLSKDRILCIPIGTGAMDVAVATVALERAMKKGLGSSFQFV